MTLTSPSSRLDNIRHSLVGLRMPRALEMLDATLRRIEQGQIDGVEALDELLTEELSLRENRRIRAALRMARLPVVKTLAGFDFAFQPSLDRNRIVALAGLDFIARAEVSTSLDHQAPARAISPPRSPSRQFVPANSSTSSHSLISSPSLPRPNARAPYVNAFASSVAPRCWSSTRSATCQSPPAAATCSSSWSMLATRRAQ